MRTRLETRREDARGWVLPASLLLVLVVGAGFDLRGAPGGLSDDDRAWLAAHAAPAVGAADTVVVAPPRLAGAVASALGRSVRAGYPETPPSPLPSVPRTTWLLARDGATLPRAAAWDGLTADERAAGDGWRLLRIGPESGSGGGDGRDDRGDGGRVVRHDFHARLADARVSVQAPGARGGDGRACAPEAGGRHRCGPDDWNFVGPYVGSVDGTPRRCIWAHPVPRGTLSLRFPSVPLGPDGVVRGGIGLLDGAQKGAPVTLRVLVDGKRRANASLPGEAGSWRSFHVRPRPGTPAAATVTFELTTSDNRWRLVCLDAVVVGPPPAVVLDDARDDGARDDDAARATEGTR